MSKLLTTVLVIVLVLGTVFFGIRYREEQLFELTETMPIGIGHEEVIERIREGATPVTIALGETDMSYADEPPDMVDFVTAKLLWHPREFACYVILREDSSTDEGGGCYTDGLLAPWE